MPWCLCCCPQPTTTSFKQMGIKTQRWNLFVKPEMQISATPSIEGPEFSSGELKEKTDKFGSKALIGNGSCGGVYCVKLNNGKTVAVKKLDVSNVEFMSQVSIVSELKHDNVVELQGYFVKGTLRVLAYEFATMGSLHDILHGREGVQEPQPGPVLDWMQQIRIAVDVARGLEYLHEKVQPFVRCSYITSSNVLLFENYKAKIADYTRSNQAPDMAAAVLRTLGYRAPEYDLTRKFTEKTDVYSFGVVLLELLTGRKPFDKTKMPLGLVEWVEPKMNRTRILSCVDPNLKGEYHLEGVFKLAQVAEACLQYNAQIRPDMKYVVRALQPLLYPAPASPTQLELQKQLSMNPDSLLQICATLRGVKKPA